MTTPEEKELLIEQAAGAWRPSDTSGIRSHPAWHDLDEEGRSEAFEAARVMRELEAGLDAEGLSTTGRAVLAKIRASYR